MTNLNDEDKNKKESKIPKKEEKYFIKYNNFKHFKMLTIMFSF